MAHAHVLREGWKSLRLFKYETIAWLVIGVVHDKYFVLRRQSMTKLYDFVGTAFFSVDILKDMIVCWDAWVLMSLCQIIDIYFESFVS